MGPLVSLGGMLYNADQLLRERFHHHRAPAMPVLVVALSTGGEVICHRHRDCSPHDFVYIVMYGQE